MNAAVTWACHICAMAGGSDNWSQVDRSAEKHNSETSHPTVTRTIGSIRHRDTHGHVSNSLVGGAA
jgi:hypothetical protein